LFALGSSDYGLITLSNLRGIKVNCENIAISDSITCKILDMRKKLVVASIFLCLMNSSFASAQISNFEDPRLTLSTVEADWLIKTDKTERPQVGSSSATLLKAENELQFQGELAAIAGNEGLVGFAFVETPLSLDLSPYKYIEFYAKEAIAFFFTAGKSTFNETWRRVLNGSASKIRSYVRSKERLPELDAPTASSRGIHA
jgi:hypothetical protein